MGSSFLGGDTFSFFSGGGGGCCCCPSEIIVCDTGCNSSVRCASGNCASGNFSTALARNNTASGYYSSITGGTCNTASNYNSGIFNGFCNTASSLYSSIFNGRVNTSSGCYGTIVNGNTNTATSVFSFVGNGILNNATTSATSTVLNGCTNTSCAVHATVLNGSLNVASGCFSTVVNGNANNATCFHSFLGSGVSNYSCACHSFVGNGLFQTASGLYSSIINGRGNFAQGDYSFIGTGACNHICDNTCSSYALGSVIVGGIGNNTCGGTFDFPTCTFTVNPTPQNTSCLSFIGGGFQNMALGKYSTVSGGYCNLSLCCAGTIGGGELNYVAGCFGTIGGGVQNNVCDGAYGSTVAGGVINHIECNACDSFIGGGATNFVNTCFSTVVAGLNNYTSGVYSFLGAGYCNGVYSTAGVMVGGLGNYLGCTLTPCLALGSVVVGGIGNNTSGGTWNPATLCWSVTSNCAQNGCYSFIGTGFQNRATSNFSLIGGGFCNNIPTGVYGTIVNGCRNLTNAPMSFIGGGICNNACNTTNGCLALGAVVVGGVGNNTTGGTWDLATCSFTVAPTICNAGQYSFVGGGFQNIALACHSFVGGGCCNIIYTVNPSGERGSVIVGGFCNCLCSTVSPNNFIGAGQCNRSSGSMSGIVSGCQNNISGGSFGGILAGAGNTVSGNYAAVISGYLSTATNSRSTAFGFQNSATGSAAFVNAVRSSTASGTGSTISGGYANTASNTYSTISNGKCNTASGTYTTIGNGFKNLGQAQYGFVGSGICNNVCNSTNGCLALGAVVVGGVGNNTTGGTWSLASCSFTVAPTICNAGQYSFVGGGFQNIATASYSSVLGSTGGLAYAYGQSVLSPKTISATGDAQNSTSILYNNPTLTTGATSILYLDGSGATQNLIPNGNNRVWNVKVKSVAVVTSITGTATGVSVGDSFAQEDFLLFKRIGGTSSVVGTSPTSTIYDTSMSTATVTFTAGASQQITITFTAPTFAGGGSLVMKVVSEVYLIETAY